MNNLLVSEKLTSKLGTSFVSGITGHATILLHLHKVQGAIQPTFKLGDIRVKGELVTQEIECLVLSIRTGLHQVDTATDRLPVGVLSDQPEVELAAGSGDTICARVVGAINAALLGAHRVAGTNRGVPFVAVVAVGRTRDGVSPSPVGIKDDTGRVGGAAAASGACLPCQRRMSLSLACASLLRAGGGDEGRNGCNLAVHVHLLSFALWACGKCLR